MEILPEIDHPAGLRVTAMTMETLPMVPLPSQSFDSSTMTINLTTQRNANKKPGFHVLKMDKT
jgi:hypothetical protein